MRRLMRGPADGHPVAVAAALAGLLLLDLVLVGLALRSSGPVTDRVETGSTPPPTIAPAETASGRPDDQQAAAAPSRPTGTLVSRAADGALAWARAGACDGRSPRLRLIANADAAAQSVDVPATSLLRVTAVAADETWVIGTDEECSPQFLRSTDGGATWTGPGDSADAWHLLPPPGRDVHAPDGDVPSPCRGRRSPVDLSVFAAAGAFALCPSGAGGDNETFGRRTTDGGATWTRAGDTTGVRAVSFLDPDQAFAARSGDEGCDAVAVVASDDGGETWQGRGCVDADPGTVAIAFASPDEGVVADAGRVFVTGDGGRSWQQVSTR